MTTITVSIWHNAAVDGQGRHTGMLEGYQPGDPMVRVFTYQASPAGGPEEIAEEAFAICNGHPRDAWGMDLAPPLLRTRTSVGVEGGRRSRRRSRARRRERRLDPGSRRTAGGPQGRVRHPPAPAVQPRLR